MGASLFASFGFTILGAAIHWLGTRALRVPASTITTISEDTHIPASWLTMLNNFIANAVAVAATNQTTTTVTMPTVTMPTVAMPGGLQVPTRSVEVVTRAPANADPPANTPGPNVEDGA